MGRELVGSPKSTGLRGEATPRVLHRPHEWAKKELPGTGSEGPLMELDLGGKVSVECLGAEA